MYMDPYMTQYNPYAGYGSVGMGMGMGGFNPYMGGMGMGGFNPYMMGMGGMGGMGGFNPYMGGMGMGMGGGFNPYMGGMGMGGFNPYMGGMGMGGFNPYMSGMGMGGMGMGGMQSQSPVNNDTFQIEFPTQDSSIQANVQQPNQPTAGFEQPSQMNLQNALTQQMALQRMQNQEQQMEMQRQQMGAGLNQRAPFPMGDTFIPSGNRAPTPFSSTMGRLGLGSQQPGQSPFGNQNTRKPIMGLGQRLGFSQQASPTQSTAQQASAAPQGVF